tara:strand:+ start:1944 stop:2150 length:207 start_codon:yes stop_codon:yes gene_type:complete
MIDPAISYDLEIISSDVFNDCLKDIEQYILEGIYNRNLASEANEECIELQNRCLREFAYKFMEHTSTK